MEITPININDCSYRPRTRVKITTLNYGSENFLWLMALFSAVRKNMKFFQDLLTSWRCDEKLSLTLRVLDFNYLLTQTQRWKLHMFLTFRRRWNNLFTLETTIAAYNQCHVWLRLFLSASGEHISQKGALPKNFHREQAEFHSSRWHIMCKQFSWTHKKQFSHSIRIYHQMNYLQT